MTFGSKFNKSMIQRIQSVYLLLAAVSSGIIIFFLPLFQSKAGNYMILQDPIFFGMTVLSTLISIFSIFRYKNRQQQVVSGRINIILNFVFFGMLMYMFYETFSKDGGAIGTGAFIPLAVVILVTLANRGIMKDETLVRAADRLR